MTTLDSAERALRAEYVRAEDVEPSTRQPEPAPFCRDAGGRAISRDA
jgi:hypothetical protein